MHKRKLYYIKTRIRAFKPYYFLVAAVVFAVIGVVGLRQNNLKTIELRDELLRVDEANGDVETALRNLREHIYSHMNSELGGGDASIQHPVQLTHTYDRLVKAEENRVSAHNEKMYTEAQTTCERQFPRGLSGSNRLKCIEEYVEAHGVQPQPIPEALYKFDFVSPAWSPDTAGISLLLAVIFGILFVISFLLDKWLIYKLRSHA